MSSQATSTSIAQHRHWTLDDIDWSNFRRDLVTDNEAIFYLVASASFVEAATDLYTQNLVDYFSTDDEITTWLAAHWLPEELQHGKALRRYVQLAWPDFDWDGVYYPRFLPEFTRQCAEDGIERTHTREMASRCIVEMGTSSYYRMLSKMTKEPVLCELAGRISDDEVRHYKHFYSYLKKYQRREGQGRAGIALASWNRLRMIDGEDSRIAMRHVYQARNAGGAPDNRMLKGMRRGWRAMIQAHFPHRMCVQMLLKPLALGPRAHRVALPVFEAIARRVIP